MWYWVIVPVIIFSFIIVEIPQILAATVLETERLERCGRAIDGIHHSGDLVLERVIFQNYAIEFRCSEGQIVVVLIDNLGNEKYIGKVPKSFKYSQILIFKRYTGPMANETVPKNTANLDSLTFAVFNATKRPVNGTANLNDVIYVWTPPGNTTPERLFTQNTTHTSYWNKTNGEWTYWPKGVRYGPLTPIDPIPQTPEGLGYNSIAQNYYSRTKVGPAYALTPEFNEYLLESGLVSIEDLNYNNLIVETIGIDDFDAELEESELPQDTAPAEIDFTKVLVAAASLIVALVFIVWFLSRNKTGESD